MSSTAMSATAADLIIHQYTHERAFSVKTRLMLGFKNAEWFAVDHATILPKPYLTPLTAGYRQIPVAQIGASIFCGSELVMDLLEARIPEPSLTRSSGPGLGRGIAHWAEDSLFWLNVQIVCASDFEATEREDFNHDRQQMLPGIYDLEAMKAALPGNLQSLRAHLDLIERQLVDGRSYIMGDSPDITDISLYFPLEFLGYCRNGNERIPAQYPAISGWMERVAALGHGQRHTLSGAEAMAVARAASPAVNPVSTVNEGPQPGDRIRVQWSAFSPADLVGVVVEAHPRTLAVAWASPEAGDLLIHFPRSAGQIAAA